MAAGVRVRRRGKDSALATLLRENFPIAERVVSGECRRVNPTAPNSVIACLRTAATLAICIMLAGCQAGADGQTAEPLSPTRLEYVREFKKIDTANKGRITMDEAIAYYSARFAELDKNHDGYLDAKELEPLLPIMNAQTTRELLLKLDRNSDNRLSRTEFLVLANWLFQLASSPSELALGDVERNMPATVPASTKKDSNDEATRRVPCPIKVPNC